MKQQEKSIYDFKKGDPITRLRPISYSDGEKDFTMVGKELIFMGIANASVYLKKDADFLVSLLTGKEDFTIQLPLEICEDGWGEYVKPDFLDDVEVGGEDEDAIKKEIKKALQDEEYEIAERLKKKLEEIRKRGDEE